MVGISIAEGLTPTAQQAARFAAVASDVGGGAQVPEGRFDPRAGIEGTWDVEPAELALARTPRFGLSFFEAVWMRFPQAQDEAVYLRWSLQPGDVYCLWDEFGGGVGAQIDSDLEYLIVWNRVESAEFGDWNGDQLETAVQYLSSLFEAASRYTSATPNTEEDR